MAEQTQVEQGQEHQQAQQGGDKAEALRQEREKRKSVEAANKALQAELDKLKAGGEVPADLDLSELDGINDEMVLQDPKKLGAMLKTTLSKVVAHTREATLREVRRENVGKDFDSILAKYPIFNDDDALIAETAVKSVLAEIRTLPTTATFADVEKAVAGVARQMSELKARGGGKAAGAADTTAPLAPGAGTAEAGNLREPVKAQGTFGAASSAALKLAGSFLAAKNAKK